MKLRTKVSLGMIIIGAGLLFGGIQLGKVGDRIPRIPAEQVTPAHTEWRTSPFGPQTVTVGGDDTPGEAKLCGIGAVLLVAVGGIFAMAGGVDLIKEYRQ